MLIQCFQSLKRCPSNHFIPYLLTCLCITFSSLPYAYASSNLVIVGDSLSAAHQIPIASGWVRLLQNRIKEQYPTFVLINASISGDTTANGLQRFSTLLDQYPPSIVVIELGGNDGLRGLPLSEIEKNLSRLIELAQHNHAKVLLVGMQLPPNYGANYTKGFAEIYPRLSKKYSIPLVPFLLKDVALRRDLMLEDGIHPGVEAQPIIADNVWPFLEPLLQGK